MSKEPTRYQLGLSNNPNHVVLPKGALTEAVNIQHTSPGAIRPRPGFRGLTVDDAGLTAPGEWIAAITDFDGYIVAITQDGGVSEVEQPDPAEITTYYYGLEHE